MNWLLCYISPEKKSMGKIFGCVFLLFTTLLPHFTICNYWVAYNILLSVQIGVCTQALKTMGEEAEKQSRVLVKPVSCWNWINTQTQPLSINYTRKHLRWFLLNIQEISQASSKKVGLRKGIFFGQWYSINEVNLDFNKPWAQMANYILYFS